MRFYLIILVLIFSTSIVAQDVIVKKDGSTILSKVIEVNSTEIKFKKSSNPEGPIYTVCKTELLSINYENGTIDRFENCETNSQSNNNLPEIVDAIPSIDNSDLILQYNGLIKSAKEKIGGFTSDYTYKYGITSNSILSSEDIEINIELNGEGSWYNAPYVINIRNKTDEMIYFDLSNCYKLKPDGYYTSYYNSTQMSISEGSNAGGSLGLGAVTNAIGIGGVVGAIANGVSIGKGNESSSSTTYTQNRYLTIPPYGKANLSSHKSAGEGKHYHVISNSEIFNIDEKYIWIPKKSLRKNETIEYSEETSPYKLQFILFYSKDSQFKTNKRVSFTLYVQQVLGVWIESNYNYLLYDYDWKKKFKDLTKHSIVGTTIRFYHNSRECGLE